jgi:phosphatidylglycerol:prolipoprotein diacylglycerol transferase
VPIAVIAFDFDPLLRIGEGLTVRWQTLALAFVLFMCLAAAVVLARRRRLRSDDLLYIAIAAAPGAIVGGRIGYLLTFPEAFGGGPLSVFDPGVGGLELGLGIVGGLVTAGVVAGLLGGPLRLWAHVAAIPLLAAVGAGKLTMVLGGSGQGRPFEGEWATAFLGPGPWVTLAADIPSHPSQVYEAIGTALVALLVLAASTLDLFDPRTGSRLLVAVGGWGAVRALASTTWRDPALLGPLPAGGLIAVAICIGAIGLALAIALWLPGGEDVDAGPGSPAWPDPENRPRF